MNPGEMAMFALEFLVLVFVCWVATRLLRLYREMIIDKHRYRYFALRDNLAMLVVRGQLEERSWEYQRIIDVINHHISFADVVSEERMVSALVDAYDPATRSTVRKLQKNVSDPDVIHILVQFFQNTRELMDRNTWVHRLLFGNRLARSKMYLEMARRYDNITHADEVAEVAEYLRDTEEAFAEAEQRATAKLSAAVLPDPAPV